MHRERPRARAPAVAQRLSASAGWASAKVACPDRSLAAATCTAALRASAAAQRDAATCTAAAQLAGAQRAGLRANARCGCPAVSPPDAGRALLAGPAQ